MMSPTRRPLVAAAFGVALVLAACGGSSPASPSAIPLSRTIQTDSFEFRFAEGDHVDTEWQEAYHRWATAALQVTVGRRILYFKYMSRTHMGDITGTYNTNAFASAQEFAIHTLWPRDNHEVVHLYSSGWGRPVALWSEGLAVACQTDPVAGDLVPRWSGTPLHDLARQFRRQGRLATIASIETTDGFRRIDSNVAYPESGSFVRYLIDTYGLEMIKRLYASGTATDDGASVERQFQAVWGRPLADVEQEWLAMLGS